MSREEEAEIVRGIEEASAEDLFPGVLGNPVTFAARYGLALSKGYLAHLGLRKRRDAVKSGRRVKRNSVRRSSFSNGGLADCGS
jgi:hypothetical protein